MLWRAVVEGNGWRKEIFSLNDFKGYFIDLSVCEVKWFRLFSVVGSRYIVVIGYCL